MPKLLVISTSYPLTPGSGSGIFIHNQAKALAEIGHDVTVLCPDSSRADVKSEMDGVRIERFRYAPRAMQQLAYGGGIPANLGDKPWLWLTVPGFVTSCAARAAKLARDADLIHAHWTAAAMAARLGVAQKPLVVSFHGSDLMTRNPLMLSAARYAAKGAAAVVVHSETMRQKATALGLRDEKVHLLPHGVDTDAVKPAKAATAKRIICVGRLSREKGQDILLDAFTHLSEQSVELHLVGTGPTENELRGLARDLGIEKRVVFHGQLPHAKAMNLLCESTLAAVPSRREGFSVFCLEAMSAGLPVVAARCGGPEDLVEDQTTGLLTPVEDSKAMTEAMEKLLGDDSLHGRLSRAARARAVEAYDQKSIITRLNEIYGNVLKRR